jgi:putative nucleotidyltransferase with HDIG domain
MFDPNKAPDQEQVLAEKFTQKLESEPNLEFLNELQEAFPELEIYLVGGMVRDTIIDHPSPKDYDFIARGVSPDELIEKLSELGDCNLKGRNFGVIKFRPTGCTFEGDEQFIDIAFPRKDESSETGGYKDFKAQVDPDLTIEDDLARRDYTINALAWDLKNKKLIDEFDGLTDLKSGKVSTVGNPEKRFKEDYSRMLRGLRFACKLDFQIDKKTWQTLVELMPHINDEREIKKTQSLERKLALATKDAEKEILQNQLQKQIDKDPEETMLERVVPFEIIRIELLKALKENPGVALELFDKSGVFEHLLPEVLEMKGCEQPPQFHSEGDVWRHTQLMLQKIHSPEFQQQFPDAEITGEFVLGVLLHDVGKPKTQEVDESTTPASIHFYGHAEEGTAIAQSIGERLTLSGQTTDRLAFMTKNHMFGMDNKGIDVISANKFARRFIDSPFSQDLLMLFYLDSLCSIKPDGSSPMKNFEDTVRRIEEINGIRTNQPEKIVDGGQVIKILETKTGPFIGCIILVLSELKDSGVINSSEQAEKFLTDFKPVLKTFESQVTSSNREEMVPTIIAELNY